MSMNVRSRIPRLALALAVLAGLISWGLLHAIGDDAPARRSIADRASDAVTGDAAGQGSGRAKEPASQLPVEPLFENWPPPELALVITGQQYGYIEPCGCTGLANQLGGLARRHGLLRELEQKGWTTVPIDGGNQVRRFGRQAELKFQFTIEGLTKMGYRAIALGPDDLRLPAFDVASLIAGDSSQPSRFMAANVTVVDPSFVPPYLVIPAADKKIGVTAVLGKREQQRVTNEDVTAVAADEALRRVLPQLVAEKCDLLVLVAQASLEETRALARQFPRFDLVVAAGTTGEPTRDPEVVDGTKTLLIQTGGKGMYAGVVGVYDDAKRRLRYQRVPLDHRFADSREMLDLLAAYQKQLEVLGLAGLGIKPVAHPSGHQFVGSEMCGECHTTAYEVWKNGIDGAGGPHAHAMESLVTPKERSEVPRHFDPECISCHVTGWHPQRHFPYVSGYLELDASKLLHGNGCENCHGPGSAHVAAEGSSRKVSDAERDQFRRQMRVALADAEKECMACHDLDNSPDFHLKGAFQKYWQAIKHEGKE